ncbi:MAG: tandem-95 repeat protein [Gammaproteobacteria bacterium]|nr:tandem-95 repeat protein [Gammaproteobacteria bacterium]MBU1731486.1 tandem-95 repeat protein [Gammaproteobacteria bacterium]MBU1892991.1 tandem-95 repeat protein [Gammaproteobacteria bacterium]
MKNTENYSLHYWLGALLLALLCSTVAEAAVIQAELENELAVRAPHEEMAVIISMSDKVNPRLFKVRNKRQHDPEHVRALRQRAVITQAPVKRFLEGRGGKRIRELWVINGIAVKVRADAIRDLASRPGIESVRLDTLLQAPAVSQGSTAIPEWNLLAVQAPELWSLGYAGSGVVVAGMDTGVDVNHPDLASSWRGGSNSWYDPHGEHLTPFDLNGHGTQTMGIMVGGAMGGTSIGVAPGARWTAVKLFNDAGQAAYSDIHLAFQWLLDPDGDAATADAPDVVNASWYLSGTTGQCFSEFNPDMENLKAAGIALVFAAGNSGPAPLSSVSPANNLAGFSAGAVDSSLSIASFSSRGVSPCDGGIYPKMVSPGVNINTSDLSFGGLPLYAMVSGTSYAAPHAAGVMALLTGAFPAASVADIETALTQSALDLGIAGPDNSYGYGITHARAAYDRLQAATNQPPVAADDSATAAQRSSAPYPAVIINVLTNDTDPDAPANTIDPATVFLTTVPDQGGWAVANPDGTISYRPKAGFSGTETFRYKVRDTLGLASVSAAFVRVSVAAPPPSANRPPLLLDDAATAPLRTAGVAYPAVIVNVLANDSDPDAPANTINPATVFLTTTPDQGGWAVANPDGTISYRPRAGFSGLETFRYKVRDTLGLASVSAAFVRVTVTAGPIAANQPPLLADDAASAPLRTAGIPYPAVIVDVLSNDADPDAPANAIDPATVFLTTVPDHGGWAVANPDGTISYRPKAGFSGTETFRYKVRDTLGLAPDSGAFVRVPVL